MIIENFRCANLGINNSFLELWIWSVAAAAAPATILNVIVLWNKVFQMEERIGLFILARQRESWWFYGTLNYNSDFKEDNNCFNVWLYQIKLFDSRLF